MATENLVTEQFKLFGIDVQKEVLTKCVYLCDEYNIDAETFVEQWIAFSLSSLKGQAPSLEGLDLLERKISSEVAGGNNAPGNGALTGVSLTVYGTPKSAQPENDIISKYMPASSKEVELETSLTNHQSDLQPATYIPSDGSSSKFASRTNAGTVVCSFGEETLLQHSSVPVTDTMNLNISQVPNEDGELYTKAMFGFELLHEKASIYDSHISYMSQCIMKKANIWEVASLRQKTQNEVVVAGRVECDADARLNPKSVVLQGTWDESLSQTVAVDIDNLTQYSLFPGQVVLLRGINPRGDKFIARELFSDAAQSIPDYKADMMNTLRGTMSVVVVAGPYTTSDNMAYEPLKDLVAYIGMHKPHLVIMTGPFMDSEHSKIKDNSMAETFKSFFDKLIESLEELNTISPYTKIYIVSSSKDAFHVNIYPTPAYSTRRRHPNVQFVPDPCTLNVNGVVIGVTSADVLMHLSQEEISMGFGGDKLWRLSAALCAQRGYLPLWPPPSALPVDAALWAAHAHMPCTPHLLVLPSNLRYFIKDVNGCVVVNPERLAKGGVGGTFARVLVKGGDDVPLTMAAQIIRI